VADSIREKIFQNIQTTLQGIRGANGCNYTVDPDNVMIIHGKRDDSAYAEPIIYIYPGSEVLNPDFGEKGSDYFELTIQIEAWIRSEKIDMNSSINKILADLITVLGEDYTRGGYAINTTFVANESFLVDLTGDKAGVMLDVKVDYETKYGKPYEQ